MTGKRIAKAESVLLAGGSAAEAAAQGLGTCILGWLDDEKIRAVCGLTRPVRLVITLGYPADTPREKKRKSIEELVTEKE